MLRPLSSPAFVRNGILLSSGMGLLVALVLLPPFVSEPVREVIMHAFAPVCHQLADRSPHLAGTQLAVCHRCFGAYTGIFIGTVIYLFIRKWPARIRPVSALAVAALPGVVDWGGDVLGIWVNSAASRVTTGAWFGLLAGLLLASAVLDARKSGPRAA